MSDGLELAQEKMAAAGVNQQAIDVFTHYYRQVEDGITGFIAEDSISPLENPDLLGDVVWIKRQRRLVDGRASGRAAGPSSEAGCPSSRLCRLFSAEKTPLTIRLVGCPDVDKRD